MDVAFHFDVAGDCVSVGVDAPSEFKALFCCARSATRATTRRRHGTRLSNMGGAVDLKMRNFTFFVICVVIAGSLLGCKKDSRPEGLPKLYPISVKIVQEGAPLEGAHVAFVSSDPKLMRWPCGGVTDVEGIAKINTYGFDGAPEGVFKVTVSKYETEGGMTAEESAEAMKSDSNETMKGESVYNLVAKDFGNSSKTTLSVEVKATNTNETPEFDVGKVERSVIMKR